MNQVALLNEYDISERRRELQSYLDLFALQMYEIVKYMPAPKRKIDLETGGCALIYDKHWTALTEKLKKQQLEILERTFPEFYKK